MDTEGSQYDALYSASSLDDCRAAPKLVDGDLELGIQGEGVLHVLGGVGR
jgi:hypothetical protein